MDRLWDFFNIYFIGMVQILMGFYFLCRFLDRKVTRPSYFLFAICSLAAIQCIPPDGITDQLVYFLLLTLGGIFLCRADKITVLLYAALTIEIMQLSYGIVHSLLNILYPLTAPFPHKFVGIAILIAGNAALLLAAFCYRIVSRYFLCDEALKKQHVFMVLTPILLIFLMGEYISSIIYGTSSGVNHYQMLGIQLLGMASLFCILFAYKKLLENFRLITELSLLEQEEHSLNQYVEEAKTRYERTRSFRHDIKNHMTVVKELVQNGKSKEALDYIGDPCLIRDIDIGIVLANALDNAIHACKQLPPGAERFIRVTGHRQNDFLLLEMENSFQGNRLPRKGTGLSNIKAVAEKYQGALSIKTDHSTFTLSILLIIPQQPEHISQHNA